MDVEIVLAFDYFSYFMKSTDSGSPLQIIHFSCFEYILRKKMSCTISCPIKHISWNNFGVSDACAFLFKPSQSYQKPIQNKSKLQYRTNRVFSFPVLRLYFGSTPCYMLDEGLGQLMLTQGHLPTRADWSELWGGWHWWVLKMSQCYPNGPIQSLF